MIRNIVRAYAVVALLVVTSSAALADRRVALVIGNSNYTKSVRLKNPANDASRLAETLRATNFDKVTLKLDLSQSDLRRTLGRFSRDAAGADIALIYFAGHGIEVDGTNYVIPTDARLSHVDDVEFEAIELSKLMSSLNRAGRLKLVILDACRNNPFKRNMTGTGSKRAIGRGLARVDPVGSDTLVAYAAREGTVADDGIGDNSPYAKALIKHITTPGLDIRLMFGRVRDEVLQSTGRRQEPFTYGSLGGDPIYLKQPQALAAIVPDRKAEADVTVAAPSAQTGMEGVFWSSIKDSDDPDMYEEYLKRFPTGMFSGLARIRIKSLKPKLALTIPPRVVLPDTMKLNRSIRWKMHSAFPKNLPVIGDLPKRIASELKRRTGGKFHLEFYEPGALTGAYAYFEPVSTNAIESAFGSPGAHAGRNSAFSFMSTFPFANGERLERWALSEGWQEMADDLYQRENVKSLPCGFIGSESAGWFRNPIREPADLKGLKMRFFGLGAKVAQRLGMTTVQIAAADIYPALERGTIDATEFSMPYIDRSLGFYQITKYNYYPSWHQPAMILEFAMNLDEWKKLPNVARTLIVDICRENVKIGSQQDKVLTSAAIKKNEADGVFTSPLPQSVLDASLTAWEAVRSETLSANPDARKVYESYLEIN